MFSFPCSYSCIFFLLFLSLSLCCFSLFFVFYPICYFSLLECLSWVCNSFYLKACFTLFTPLYSPPRLCFLSGLWNRSPIYLCLSLTPPHTALFPIISSHLLMLALCTTASHLAASSLSSCSEKFIMAFFLYLFKPLAGKLAAVW